MPTIDALRLAQLHNHIDKMNHAVTTREKVALCRNLLKRMFGNKKTLEWKKACESVLGESMQRLELVFYLSGLNEQLSSLVDSILQKYGRLELMGQKVSSKVLKKLSAAASESQTTTVDCPVSKFKCLRGNLSDEEIKLLLVEVNDGKLSFAGLEKDCRRLKELKELRRHLTQQSGCESWDEAKERFPTWATDQRLEDYRGSLKPSPERFNVFISSMLKWEQRKKEQTNSGPQENQVIFKKSDDDEVSVYLLCEDVIALTNTTLSRMVKQFAGSTLIFLHLDKDWDKMAIEKIFRNIKAINTRHDTGTYRIVIFPNEQTPYGQLSLAIEVARSADLTYDMAYYHQTNKHLKESYAFSKTITPFAICATKDALAKIKKGNLFSYEATTNYSYPWELYSALIDLFKEERGWIMDLSSGSGSVAKASVGQGKNCVVVEATDESIAKLRRSLEEDSLV